MLLKNNDNIYKNAGGFMEIPFDYILISIMINLKNRKVKAEVSKQSLIKIINKIIYNLNVNEKEKLEIINILILNMN